jgi:hypothetical protein
MAKEPLVFSFRCILTQQVDVCDEVGQKLGQASSSEHMGARSSKPPAELIKTNYVTYTLALAKSQKKRIRLEPGFGPGTSRNYT